ncbi:CHAT domain-containing protein [Actinokineospora iranica]|uniref:CHAT domain-containing protein n=1 Tax=Actinokineospora iranica TaxID=1271860 RepID=A0A1G6QJZ6_9PSEU|nr:CHAT domain-containing protein [Actinokineospora iranica]
MTWAARHAEAVDLQDRGEPLRARVAASAAVGMAGSATQRAESRLVLAWVSHQLGDRDTSAGLIALARPALTEGSRARADCLTGLILCQDGEHAAALPILDSAVDGLAEDPHWQANALVGLGVAAAYLRRFTVADAALSRAHALYTGLGEHERASTCKHNQGFVAAQSGDLTAALAHYAAAGVDERRRPETLVDRASALLQAGLVRAAGADLARAGALLGAAGRGPAFAEATLAHGLRALRMGDLRSALGSARRAADLFAGRPSWLAAARALDLRTRLALGERPAGVAEAADACERAGRQVEAAELRLAAGLPELVQDRRHADVPALRALGWLARARVAKTRRGVLAACRAGLRGPVPEPERTDLAATGLGAAVESGRARTVFGWIERQRTTFCLPADRRERLSAALGTTTALCFFTHGGQVGAVSVSAGRWRLHYLGSESPVHEAAESLRRAAALTATVDRCGDTAARAARRLDAALFGPLSAVAGDRSLVIVPTPGMESVPWAALPTCAGRPVAVTPSMACWLDARAVESTGTPPVWIAGPGLDHAEAEVTALHRKHGGVLLTGSSATKEAVLRAIDNAGIAHIAAHGRHHPDAPLFSTLDLADGSLHSHDLGRLARPPRLTVLSSCESGRALALPAALLQRGARAVVASTVPVPDAGAAALVGALHDHLAAGADTAAALARAQSTHGHLGFIAIGA